MLRKPARGLFVVGTDTGVGKTYVASLIVRGLRGRGSGVGGQGPRVGVYKPVASGCHWAGGTLVSEDAEFLAAAAGGDWDLDRVCPQRFAAAVAPPRAAREVGMVVDRQLLRTGLEYFADRCDVVVVEGAGGLLSPLSDDDLVADLAHEFGYPLVIVANNALGVINQTLQTVFVAQHYRGGLPIAGVVLNHARETSPDDASLTSNAADLAARLHVPLLATVSHQGNFDTRVDWWELTGVGHARGA